MSTMRRDYRLVECEVIPYERRVEPIDGGGWLVGNKSTGRYILTVPANDSSADDEILQIAESGADDEILQIAESGVSGKDALLKSLARRESGDRMITVCDACERASCWHGEFMCQQGFSAGVAEYTRRELWERNLEHPSNYSDSKLLEVTGRETCIPGEGLTQCRS